MLEGPTHTGGHRTILHQTLLKRRSLGGRVEGRAERGKGGE